MTGKTDNHDPRAKLDLRRYFLRKFHASEPIHILDCCMGHGRLWDTLRREFPVASYWGLDVKPKKGRLKLDSARVLAQSGWPQNVVDIDTYGSPWKHWLAMLPNVVRPITVFVTVGKRGIANKNLAMKSLSREEAASLGFTLDLSRFGKHTQMYFGSKLSVLARPYCLARAIAHGLQVVEAVQAMNSTTTEYIGVRLEPQNSVEIQAAEVYNEGRQLTRASALTPARSQPTEG